MEISQKALARELAQAAAYVRSLLPEPVADTVSADWRFIPSVQLGGDAFGYHWLDPEHFALYLLDVSGHGVKSALLSMTAMNAIRTRTLGTVDFLDPAAVLYALNQAFQMDVYEGMYFSIWYGVFHRPSRRLVFADGGHPPGLPRVEARGHHRGGQGRRPGIPHRHAAGCAVRQRRGRGPHRQQPVPLLRRCVRDYPARWKHSLLLGSAWAADLPGSRDHPLLKRFGGSEIVGYDAKRFDTYELQTSTFKRYNLEAKRREFDSPPLKLEGALTRIWYEAPGEASSTELIRNYQNELKTQGFEMLYDSANDPAATAWTNFLAPFADMRIKTSRGYYLFYAADHQSLRVASAKLTRPEGDVYVYLTAVEWPKDDPIYKAKRGAYVAVDIIEMRPIVQHMVVVSADEMSQTIASKGRVALYGILFDFNKEDLKAESRPALEEIAKLLQGNFIKKNPVISRTLEIRGDPSLAQLHKIIIKAFDRFDEHLYEFQVGGKGPNDPKAKRYGVPAQEDEIFTELQLTENVTQTTLDDLKVKKDETFGYLFEFGDDWWHQINVDAIEEKTPKITDRVGLSPPQYMALDEQA